MNRIVNFYALYEYSNRCVILVLVTIILMAVTLSALPFLTEHLQAADQNKQNVPIQKSAELLPCGLRQIRLLFLKRPKVT